MKRKCKSCGKQKDLERQFYKYSLKYGRIGYMGKCRSCHNKAAIKYRKQHSVPKQSRFFLI